MRLYQFFLHLYPASFRAEYGDELCRLFRQERSYQSGGVSIFLFWVQQLFDIAGNAARVHWDILLRDLSYTVRTATRSPGFAVTAVLVTALGIGANTAVFSIVNHVLIRPLPYVDSDRLVTLYEASIASAGWNELSPSNFRDMQRMSTGFESIAAYTGTSMNLVGKGIPERVDGAMVTSNLLPLLGVKPEIGRLFRADEDRDGASGAVILSFGLWQSSFGGDPRVLGESIRLNDESHTVIGIMGADFSFPTRETQFWVPYRFTPEDFESRDNTYLNGIGKLKKNISLEHARAEMMVIAQKLEQEFPVENAKQIILVRDLRTTMSTQQSRLLLVALLGASICILLIACTNLANLLLVRAINRRRELTVRAALGAGRERLVRQLLTESIAFAIVGAVLGVIVAHMSMPVLSKLIPSSLPVSEARVIDVRVLGFAAILLCFTGIIFGVIPALRVCRKTDSGALREGARSLLGDRKEKLRSLLVMAEVTAAVVLLISSGLLIRALWKVQSVHPGFDPNNVLTMQTPVAMPKYEVTAKRADFYSRVLNDVRALPEVSSAGYITSLPMVLRGGIWGVLEPGGIDRDPGSAPPVSLRFVSSGFFDSLGIPIRLGRDVGDSDTFEAPWVAVVSESFVKRHYPRDNPIGRKFHVAFGDRTIVGVVGDIRVRGLERNSEPQVYLPYRQVEDRALGWYAPKTLVIRTSAEISTMMGSVRNIIQKVDPEMPISDVRMLQDVLQAETASRETQIRIIGIFTALSLLLAAIGIHGLLAFSVTQRLPEIGLRIALGAPSGDILKMILRKGFQIAAIGIFIGMILAYAAGRGIETLLAGIKPGDWITFLIAAVVAMVMTISGCIVPAWRAIRIDPASVIRAE